MSLVCAPAGSGKTTVLSQWAAECGRPFAWLSLDAGDKTVSLFLSHVIASVRTVQPGFGEALFASLDSPQKPSVEWSLKTLVNELVGLTKPMVLVLDDYHLVDAPEIDDAVAFLLERMPPSIHLVIATREDPQVPLARLRARDQLTELRSADLRFSLSETATFLTKVMDLTLSERDIAALEERTEGWIVGLNLAAIALQGHSSGSAEHDPTAFIDSFTGSHRFIVDYLLEEVMQRQSTDIQAFLLRTSILDQLCGPLCDAVVGLPSGSSQRLLEHLEQANLFVVALDNERHWYRYHQLFADLLRHRLKGSPAEPEGRTVAQFHTSAGEWYHQNGFVLNAFLHATAAGDIDRAEYLISSSELPLHAGDAASAVLGWLESLPQALVRSRPLLAVTFALMSLLVGQTAGVETTLLAAQNVVLDRPSDDEARDLLGRIATARAILAFSQYQIDAVLDQSRAALVQLHPENVNFRTTAYWTLGIAHQSSRDATAARKAYGAAVALSRQSDDAFQRTLAMIGLGQLHEAAAQLHAAAGIYRRIVETLKDRPFPVVSEAHQGLARIQYHWNDLDAALVHAEEALEFARRYDETIDRSVLCQVFLVRIHLARDEMPAAERLLDEAGQIVRYRGFEQRIADIAAARVRLLVARGEYEAAAVLADAHALRVSGARARLFGGEIDGALTILEPLIDNHAVDDAVNDGRASLLEAQALAAAAYHGRRDSDRALHLLSQAVAEAEPERCIRAFVDGGETMRPVLLEAASRGIATDFLRTVLSALTPVEPTHEQSMNGPLSERELEVLLLLAEGLPNREIGDRLFIALDTVKGHNRKLFAKLNVKSRAGAIARARRLGLL